MSAFAPEYWGGPVYHDLSKAFYKAVNGGTLLHGSVLGLLNPFGPVIKRINEVRPAGSKCVKRSPVLTAQQVKRSPDLSIHTADSVLMCGACLAPLVPRHVYRTPR